MRDTGWWRQALAVALPPGLLALGITLGGGLLGAWGTWLAGAGLPRPGALAYRLRFWAVAAAMGGTFTAFEQIERHLASRGPRVLLRDLAVLGAAYLGARAGAWILNRLGSG
ncbi:MAG: sporulation protein [Firmicutes bacterium]|nr:sporulation protein [Bacillota bacterium]